MKMPRPFEGVFGNTCELRLLEFLLPLDDMEFNITELSEEVGVSRVTVGRLVKKFVAWGILNASTERITQYSINPSSPIIKALEIMNNALIGQILGEEKTIEIQVHLRRHAIESHPQETESLYDFSRSSNPDMEDLTNVWCQGSVSNASGYDSWSSGRQEIAASE